MLLTAADERIPVRSSLQATDWDLDALWTSLRRSAAS